MTQLQTAPAPSDVDALARLPRDIAIVKLENDSMMAMAAVKARSHLDILEDIKVQLQTYKSLAQSAMYSKPVGKDRSTGQMKYARGLSIRAAEAVSSAIGCNAMRENITLIDEDTVQLSASFTDFARGRITQKTCIVSKTYRSYQGQPKRHSDDRFFNVVVKAEMAKLRRDAILDMVPPGLKSELMLIADEQIMRFMDDKTVEKMVAQFANKDVTVAMLEKTLGGTRANWTWDDRKKLVGIWASLEDGESTVAEHFGEPAKATESDLLDEYRKTPEASAGEAGKQADIADSAKSAPAEAPAPVGPGAAADSQVLGVLRSKLTALYELLGGPAADDVGVALGRAGIEDIVDVDDCTDDGILKEAIKALQDIAKPKGKGAPGKQGTLA